MLKGTDRSLNHFLIGNFKFHCGIDEMGQPGSNPES